MTEMKNMTTATTRAESDQQLEKLGLLTYLKNARYTGVSYIIQVASKEMVVRSVPRSRVKE